MTLPTLTDLLGRIRTFRRRAPDIPGGSGMAPPGPPIVAAARRFAARRSDIIIEPLETEFRVEPSRLLVRAWVIIPTGDLPISTLNAAARLEDLDPQARRAFYLSASYGLSLSEIAETTGYNRRRIRRWLLSAIARVDGRSL